MADDNPYLSLTADSSSEENPYMAAMQSPLPDHENFLQKAIRQFRGPNQLPTSGVGMLPTNGQETQDVGNVLMRNFMDPGTHMLPINIGANMSDPAGSFKNQLGDQQIQDTFAPQTQYGKNLDFAAKASGPAMLGLEGASAAGRGIDSLINPNPVQNQMATTDEFKNLLTGENDRLGKVDSYLGKRGNREVKNASTKNRASIEEFGYTGSKDIGSKVGAKFDEARSKYRDMLDSINPENVNVGDLVNVLDKTIESKGILGKEFPSPEEQRLVQMRFKAAGKIPTAEEQMSTILDASGNRFSLGETKPEMPKISDATDFKSFKDEVLRSLGGRRDLEGEFLNHYGDMLEEKGLGGIAEANKEYKDAYSAFNSSKKLGKTSLKRAATTMSDPEISSLKGIEQNVGTDYIGEAKKMRESQAAKKQGIKTKYAGARSSVQDLIKGNTENIGELDAGAGEQQNQLQGIMNNRKIATGSAASLPLIGGLLKYIFGNHGDH